MYYKGDIMTVVKKKKDSLGIFISLTFFFKKKKHFQRLDSIKDACSS